MPDLILSMYYPFKVSVFLVLYAYFENTPEVFYRSREYAKSILSYSVIALKTFKGAQV
jgi:hypothetical protein